jgi:tRNA-dihydrouridine synthase B
MSLLKPVTIGNLEIQNNLFLAPLAGIGDNAFRVLGRRYGAGLTFSEMVSANGIVRGNMKTLDLLRITDDERPLGIQLFGSDPGIMGDAVGEVFSGANRPELIDVNGGCSVRKVLKTGSGAAILADPSHFHRLLRACVDASPFPVSVKIRLGMGEDSINVVENALAAQDAGVALLTLHPRTAAAKYSGIARWEYIARVKEAVGIPVCGNGDIRSGGDAVRMIEETGCDALMVGRAIVGNPWLLAEIVATLDAHPGASGYERPSAAARIALALEHLDLAISFKGERRAVGEMKRHLHRYIRGMRDAAAAREEIFRSESVEDMRGALHSLKIHET